MCRLLYFDYFLKTGPRKPHHFKFATLYVATQQGYPYIEMFSNITYYKMLSYRRETALQVAL